MRSWRDTTFLSWATIVVVLGSVLLAAWLLGQGPQPRAVSGHLSPASGSLSLPATRSGAALPVAQLTNLEQAGMAAGTDAAGARAWAAQVATIAHQASQVRAQETSDAADPLLVTLSRTEQTAQFLSAHATSAVAVAQNRSALLLLIDRASNLTAGVPVPAEAPQVVGLSDDATAAPQVPTLPPLTPPTRPTPAAPLPTGGPRPHSPATRTPLTLPPAPHSPGGHR